MFRNLFFLLCALVCFFHPNSLIARDWKPNCQQQEKITDFVCSADTLSWVVFTTQESNTNIKKDSKEIESLMRAVAKKELPLLTHEVKSFQQTNDEFDFIKDFEEFDRRTELYCHLWTVGSKSGFPVAYNLKCSLQSYGLLMNPVIRQESLGYCSAEKLKSVLKNAIREELGEISEAFYGRISKHETQAASVQSVKK